MPRKKANQAEILQFEIKTRVNERRFRYLNELLSKSKHGSMSELVRNILENRPVKIIVHDDSLELYMKSLASIKKELNAIGTNINQLTKQFHSTPSDEQRATVALTIAEQNREVEKRVNSLHSVISELGKKWLQK